MRADLSGLDWGSLFTGNANDDWELIKNVLLQLINNHCPLTSFFQSVYTNEARFLPPSTEELPTPSVSDILFSEGIVRRQLEALNESKSPGPDEIPPKLLKELASELSVPLSMLFQTSFDTGTLPIDWEPAHITPLHKGGVGGNFLKWIENFLVGRHQVVCIGRGKSDPAVVESGVPQGSVLGTILFLIYVDAAARALDCEVTMFADDMKIWSVIRGPADEDRLQMNLNRLEEWSNRWLLRFNVAKCSILRLGNTAISASTRGYFLGGAALQEVEAQKDVGVLTTSSLKPSAHCSRVAKNAMQLRGDLLQAFRIVKWLDSSLAFEDFFEFATTTNLRGHPFKLRTQQARLDVRKFSFSVRVVKPWNALPADVVMSPSIQNFKKNLDIFMLRNDEER
nr:unnamed protein product [Spirometra erinaceieuropaei]